MRNDNVYQTEKYKGFVIGIHYDTDPQNPRTDWSPLGTMVCWHSRHNLGEDHTYQEADYLFAEIAGIDRDSDYCMGIYDKQGYQALTEYLYNAACKKAIILPLYLYDHSGITMSTGSFGDRWDSGQVGYIYITLDKARKEYSWKTITKERRAKLISYLQGEVEAYDNFLTGEVYGFNAGTEEDESLIHSCWGYFGDTGINEAIEDAKGNIDCYIKRRIQRHINQVKVWIKNRVPVIYRTPLQLTA